MERVLIFKFLQIMSVSTLYASPNFPCYSVGFPKDKFAEKKSKKYKQ